jgi:MHS family proline/betaine transporter-like MFS transporter
MKLNKKVLTASMVGGTLEIYDLTVYGLMATTLAPIFFNPAHPFSSLIQSYGAFCIGFLARPLGAVVFGHIGDFLGRKMALVLSATLMAFSTLALGLLPTYETIGIWASLGVFVIRILQGISVGGEYTGGLIFAIEHSPPEKRGMAGGLVVAGYMGGVFLGSITSFLFTLPSMPSWGWRLPFIFGFLIIGVGLYIRNKIQESPEFITSRKSSTVGVSFFNDFMKNPTLFLGCIAAAGAGGVFCYGLAVYIPTYLKSQFSLPLSTAMFIPILLTFCMMLGNLSFGILSDRVGRLKMMKLGAMLMTPSLIPLFYLLNSEVFLPCIIALLGVGFLSTIFCGPMNTFIVETFAPLHRYRSAALSYSLGMSIFGGTAPLVSSWLTHFENGIFLLACYFFLSGLMGLAAIKLVEGHFRQYITFQDLISREAA